MLKSDKKSPKPAPKGKPVPALKKKAGLPAKLAVKAKPAAPPKEEKVKPARKRPAPTYRSMRKHTVVRMEALLAEHEVVTIRNKISRSKHLQTRGPLTALEFLDFLKTYEKQHGKDWSERRAANNPTKAAAAAVKAPAEKKAVPTLPGAKKASTPPVQKKEAADAKLEALAGGKKPTPRPTPKRSPPVVVTVEAGKPSPKKSAEPAVKPAPKKGLPAFKPLAKKPEVPDAKAAEL